MKKLTLSVCLTALTLGGLLAAALPLTAATSVKKSANPELVPLSDGEEALLKTDLSAKQLEKTPVKMGHTMPALKVLPSRAEADQTMVTLLDSMVTTENGSRIAKTVYAYDDFGRRVLTATLSKSTTSEALDTITKQESRYDNEGNILLYATYRRNAQEGVLEPINLEVSTYGKDGDNNLTMLRTYYVWDGDSAKLIPSTKQEATFIGPKMGPYKQLIEYQFTYNDGWQFSSKIIQDVDVDGYDLISENYSWDVTRETWVGLNKWASVYDEESDRLILRSNYEWSESIHAWYLRYDERFDANDRLESRAEYTFDVDAQQWVAMERRVFDAEGDQWFQELTIFQKWDSIQSVWVNIMKEGYEVDEVKGDVARMVQYKWDETSNEWENGYYWTKVWDDNANLIKEQHFVEEVSNEWAEVYSLVAEYDNLTGGEWLVTTWMEAEYNLDGQQTSYTQMWRSSSLDPWYENYTYKQVSVFNELGDRTLVTTYYWDETLKTWYLSWKRAYTYNDDTDISLSIRYTWTGSDWNEVSRNTYYYSQKLVGVQAIQVRLDVYPNPVADRLVIKGAAEGAVILVRDLNGRTLRSLKAVGEETSVEMSTLPAGIYLVQVGKQVVKIVK